MSRRVPLAAGSLDQRVTLSRPRLVRDEIGGLAASSSLSLPTIAASVRPVTLRESAFASQIGVRPSHVVTIRYRDDVKTGDRLTWRGRDYRIEQAIERDARREALDLYVTAVEVGT